MMIDPYIPDYFFADGHARMFAHCITGALHDFLRYAKRMNMIQQTYSAGYEGGGCTVRG